MTKALFLTNHARCDIQTTVECLCTRVKSLDQDNLEKIGRMIRYLRATQGIKLTLKSNGINVVKCWVDDAHGLHLEMRVHTGKMISLGSKGQGAVYSGSSKHKINTKSSM